MEGGRGTGKRSISHEANAKVWIRPFLAHPLSTTHYICRVFSTVYTGDARFVLSGSDDGNVRIWKAHASDRLGIVAGRERAAREYRAKLREKWKYDPEVGKIERYIRRFDSVIVMC